MIRLCWGLALEAEGLWLAGILSDRAAAVLITLCAFGVYAAISRRLA